MNSIDTTTFGLVHLKSSIASDYCSAEVVCASTQLVANSASLLADGVQMIIPLFVGIAAIVIGIIALSHHLEKERTKLWEKTAHDLGLSFLPVDDGTVSSQVEGFSLFNKGHSRKLKNIILADTENTSLSIFDYQYTTGSGKNARTYKFTLVAMKSQSLSLPHFTLRKEGLFDKIGAALGGQDIDFDEHPKFSSSFVLKAENETLVRQFFEVELLDFFAQRPGILIEARDGAFVYSHGGRRKPEEIRQTMSECFEIYKALGGE